MGEAPILRRDFVVDGDLDVSGAFTVRRAGEVRAEAENAVGTQGNSVWRVAAGGVLIERTRPNVPRLEAAAAVSADLERARQAEAEAAASAPPAAALGNNADFAPPPPGEAGCFVPAPSTVRAWYLRSCGRDILWKGGVSLRMRHCGARIRRGQDGVGVYARPDRAYGRVNGVCVCGQSLACPVCAPRIAAFRSAEVSEAFTRARARGYEARQVTFTMPHFMGSDLGAEISAFSEAWRRQGKGKAGDKLRAYSLGHHVGREVTYGQHGWHYHHHQLRYDKPGTFDEERAKYYWLAALRAVGRYSRGVDRHAFDVGVVGDAAGAAYCAKLALSVEAQARAVGREVASSATKGRNLATLLACAADGDLEAARIWLHGAETVSRRKVSSVRWSRGLRAELGFVAEKSDEEVAKDEVLATDVFLGSLNALQWRGVLLHRAEFALCVAANKGECAVNEFLAGLGLGRLDDAPPPAVVTPLEAETCYKGFAPVVSERIHEQLVLRETGC